MTDKSADIKMRWEQELYILVVRPVLKRKTGFRGFETERNPGFRKFTDMIKSLTRAYMSYILNRK